MNMKFFFCLLIGISVLTACASPAPTQPILATPTFIGTNALPVVTNIATSGFTPLPALMATPQPDTSTLCTDPQVVIVIDSLKTAIRNADGTLLASLVSPANGLDVRYFRYGTVVNYDQAHAKFLFETTYEVDWGAEPGSGAAKVGPFHDVIMPKLVEGFGQTYTLHCNELKHGGASYDVIWPYEKDFYSIYFPGTEANGNLDWHTWVAGVEYVNGKPYLYGLSQYFWEP